ncbi:hypothetical protein ACHAXH_000655 [Discostella pseudostelligera]
MLKVSANICQVGGEGAYGYNDKDFFVGPATKRGMDLPSGKKLVDYIDKQGRMCLVCFFRDHKVRIPIMLGVRNYERLAILSSILRVVYSPDWVAKEYLRQCKSGAWKQVSDDESLKCWNLERILWGFET